MSTRDWWKSAIVYQIYPRSFADSDGDGVGDLGGVIAHLDHLERLEVDVVWLSPVYRSPMDDNGYDISDYQDVDPLFGTLEQLDELIERAHAKHIKIVMDLVVNHTSDEHPWFVESRSSTDNPKRDWYWWRPPREGYDAGAPGAEPTRWGSAFSGSAWTHDAATGEYYLHLFSPKQPDLNWENAEVREAVYAMMNWWLDRGVDGFRMDVINLISKVTEPGVPGLPDGELGDRAPHGSGVIDLAHWADPTPYVVNGPRVHEFLAEMHAAVFTGRDAELITVGETPGASVADAREFTDPARGELDMVFTFEHVDLDCGPGGKWDVVPFTLPQLKANLGGWQEGLAEVGWNSLYWGNHDQPRAVSKWGSDAPEHRVASAQALATVLHLHRGTPYVYQGDELGMTNHPFGAIEDFRDIESLNRYQAALARGEDAEEVLAALRYRSRDNARTPMQWTSAEGAGFSDSEPWIAVNPNHVEINAASQYDDPDSVFAHHQRVIALRHDEPVVAHGDFTMLLPEHEQLYAFTRSLDGTTLLVVANLSDQPVDVRQAGLDTAWLETETLLTSGPPAQAEWVLPRGPRRCDDTRPRNTPDAHEVDPKMPDTTEATATIGLTGLATMGRNLARNIARNGFTIAVHNRTTQKTTDLVDQFGDEGDFVPAESVEDFVASIKQPRAIVIMVKAGDPTDAVIDELVPLLDEGDILVDGGNAHFTDTVRREKALSEKGIHFVGMGVSGGEVGALEGPSIMVGGSDHAYETLGPIVEKIAAQVDGTPCATHVGPDGAGHFVKMVHNGIEYADMQLIAESYDLLRSVLGLEPKEIAEVFKEWNGGDLESFLIEMTADVLAHTDEATGKPFVDIVLDQAEQKGTGRWTVQSALDLGVPITGIAEATFARSLSGHSEQREAAQKVFATRLPDADVDPDEFKDQVRAALYASKVVAYAQGFDQIAAGSDQYDWGVDPGMMATIWRGGCIIRAAFLDRIKEAYADEPDLTTLLTNEFFANAVSEGESAWRDVVSTSAQTGVPTPAFSSSLAYFDGLRRDRLPAALIQGLRDNFGAHTYQRVDREGTFHTLWAGDGSEIEE